MLAIPSGTLRLLLFALAACLFIKDVRSEGRVVCYYTNWSVYRPGTAKFNPQNINPYLCTHLIYAFGGFTKDNQMKPFDKYQDIEQGGYAKFTGLKTYNKQLKTMIAIGGWNEASSRFSPLVASPERRHHFIKNILKFLRQNHFDGIDLDWEYPAHREGGKPRDRENYALFVQEMRAEFERESQKTGRPRLLITMAVPAGIEYIEKGYDIPKLNKYLDWFNVLTYDFHSSHEPSVNHHAPLYSLEEESEYNYDTELNIDYSIKYYLKAGADRDKLVLGIPTYGRSFTLINEESTDMGAPAEGPGEQGDATREKGYLAYYEICQNIKEDPEWTVVQPNANAMGPYAYRRNQWVGYDDEAIARKKAAYVVDQGLGGIMFWAIDNDDFRGACGGKPYPLIEAAKEELLSLLGLGINEVSKPGPIKKPLRSRSRDNLSSTRNRIGGIVEEKPSKRPLAASRKRVQAVSTTTTEPTTTTIKLTYAEGSSLYVGGRTTTPAPPTTPDPGADFKCEEEGFFQHPRDCKKYFWCLDSGPSGLGIVAHQFTCPSGLYFNPAADSCDFARNVPCKTKKSTTAAPPITSTTVKTSTSRPSSFYTTSRQTTARTTTTRTTTTTTAAPEQEEYEYEDEEEVVTKEKDAEEDPKVLKELIELIRKVGGIDELEKHLLRKDDGTISLKDNDATPNSRTTASPISKSLVDKVLSRPNTYNSFRNRYTSSTLYRKPETIISKKIDEQKVEVAEEEEEIVKDNGSRYSSVVRNARPRPQNDGLDKLPEFDSFIKEKKAYVTINRGKTKNQLDNEEQEAKLHENEDEEEEEEIDDEEELEEEAIKSTQRPAAKAKPTYATIRRTRPTDNARNEEVVTTNEEEEVEKKNTNEKTYASFNRNRSRSTTTTPTTTPTKETLKPNNRYSAFGRTATPSNAITEPEAGEADEEDVENENEERQNVRIISNANDATQNTQIYPTKQYAQIGRRTTTTTTTSTTSTTTTSTTTPQPELSTTSIDSATTTTTTDNPATSRSSNNIIETTTTTNLNNLNPITTASSNVESSSHPNLSETYLNLSQNDISNVDLIPDINSLILNPTAEDLTIADNDTQDTTTTTTNTTPSTTTPSKTTTTDSEIARTTDLSDDSEYEVTEKTLVNRNKLYNNRVRTTSTTTTSVPISNVKDKDTNNTVSKNNNTSRLNKYNSRNPLSNSRENSRYAENTRNKSSELLKIKSQQKTANAPTTNPTNELPGVVSSPRPFGFPKRRSRPTTTITQQQQQQQQQKQQDSDEPFTVKLSMVEVSSNSNELKTAKVVAIDDNKTQTQAPSRFRFKANKQNPTSQEDVFRDSSPSYLVNSLDELQLSDNNIESDENSESKRFYSWRDPRRPTRASVKRQSEKNDNGNNRSNRNEIANPSSHRIKSKEGKSLEDPIEFEATTSDPYRNLKSYSLVKSKANEKKEENKTNVEQDASQMHINLQSTSKEEQDEVVQEPEMNIDTTTMDPLTTVWETLPPPAPLVSELNEQDVESEIDTTPIGTTETNDITDEMLPYEETTTLRSSETEESTDKHTQIIESPKKVVKTEEIRKTTQRPHVKAKPTYASIRRTRPTVNAEQEEEVDTKKEEVQKKTYASFNTVNKSQPLDNNEEEKKDDLKFMTAKAQVTADNTSTESSLLGKVNESTVANKLRPTFNTNRQPYRTRSRSRVINTTKEENMSSLNKTKIPRIEDIPTVTITRRPNTAITFDDNKPGTHKSVVHTNRRTTTTTRGPQLFENEDSYEDQNEEVQKTVNDKTARPILRNRGSVKFRDSDLSSLLSFDFAPKPKQVSNVSQIPKTPILRQRMKIAKSHEIEVTTETTRKPRPTRPQRTTITTKENDISEIKVSTARFRKPRPTRPQRTTTSTTTTPITGVSRSLRPITVRNNYVRNRQFPVKEQELESDDEDSLTDLQEKLKSSLQKLNINAKNSDEDEVNREDLNVPIYHRRKYYQYFNDSPSKYVEPVNPLTDDNINIEKQIKHVFNLSNDESAIKKEQNFRISRPIERKPGEIMNNYEDTGQIRSSYRRGKLYSEQKLNDSEKPNPFATSPMLKLKLLKPIYRGRSRNLVNLEKASTPTVRLTLLPNSINKVSVRKNDTSYKLTETPTESSNDGNEFSAMNDDSESEEITNKPEDQLPNESKSEMRESGSSLNSSFPWPEKNTVTEPSTANRKPFILGRTIQKSSTELPSTNPITTDETIEDLDAMEHTYIHTASPLDEEENFQDDEEEDDEDADDGQEEAVTNPLISSTVRNFNNINRLRSYDAKEVNTESTRQENDEEDDEDEITYPSVSTTIRNFNRIDRLRSYRANEVKTELTTQQDEEEVTTVPNFINLKRLRSYELEEDNFDDSETPKPLITRRPYTILRSRATSQRPSTAIIKEEVEATESPKTSTTRRRFINLRSRSTTDKPLQALVDEDDEEIETTTKANFPTTRSYKNLVRLRATKSPSRDETVIPRKAPETTTRQATRRPYLNLRSRTTTEKQIEVQNEEEDDDEIEAELEITTKKVITSRPTIRSYNRLNRFNSQTTPKVVTEPASQDDFIEASTESTKYVATRRPYVKLRSRTTTERTSDVLVGKDKFEYSSPSPTKRVYKNLNRLKTYNSPKSDASQDDSLEKTTEINREKNIDVENLKNSGTDIEDDNDNQETDWGANFYDYSELEITDQLEFLNSISGSYVNNTINKVEELMPKKDHETEIAINALDENIAKGKFVNNEGRFQDKQENAVRNSSDLEDITSTATEQVNRQLFDGSDDAEGNTTSVETALTNRTATVLPKRRKVIKYRRPLGESLILKTNSTLDIISSNERSDFSASNSIQTVPSKPDLETQTTNTTLPKRIRKIIRKYKPTTTETPDITNKTRTNNSRYGFGRSSNLDDEKSAVPRGFSRGRAVLNSPANLFQETAIKPSLRNRYAAKNLTSTQVDLNTTKLELQSQNEKVNLVQDVQNSKVEEDDEEESTTEQDDYEENDLTTTIAAPRRKLIAKRPYISTKTPQTSTTEQSPTTQFVPRKFEVSNKISTKLNIVEVASSTPQDDDDEEYDEEDDEEEEEESTESFRSKEILATTAAPPSLKISRPVLLRNFTRNSTTTTEKPEENEDYEEDEENDYDVDTPKPTILQKIDNRVLPNARPLLRPAPKSSTPKPRYGLSSRKPIVSRFSGNRVFNRTRVVNRPQGVISSITVKPETIESERKPSLRPSKIPLFKPTNTRSYERKYTVTTTDTTENINDTPILEDLNVEALNARNKKIFDNNKKLPSLKPKIQTKSQNTTQSNTQHENDNNDNNDNETSTVTPILNIATTTPANNITQYAINSSVNEFSSQDALEFTTQATPTTTLLHIFTLFDDMSTSPKPPQVLDDDVVEESMAKPRLLTEEPKHKVVEINRIVEITSKEDKLRRKTTNHKEVLEPIGKSSLKVVSLPHLEQLGEISVVKFVHQVDGRDILVDGHSTVADYTPTEATVRKGSSPVRNTIPGDSVVDYLQRLNYQVQGYATEISPVYKMLTERYGKALIPEVIREGVETSTLSLEGLFDSSRKAKKLTSIDESDIETSTISTSIEGMTTDMSKFETTVMPDDVSGNIIESVGTSTESVNTPKPTTISSSFNHNYLRSPTTNSPLITTPITRRPLLSVRRRITPNLSANDSTTTEREASTSKYNRNRNSFSGSNSTPSHQQVKTSNRESFNNLKSKSSFSVNAESSTTANRLSNVTKYSSSLLRHKFQPRRLTTTTQNADSVTEFRSTANPLFKRRLTTVNPTTTTTIVNLQTTLVPGDLEDPTDQEAKSSIHSSFINQFTALEERNGKLKSVPTSIPQNRFTFKDGITRRMDIAAQSNGQIELTTRASQKTTRINPTKAQIFANRRGHIKNKDAAFERLKVSKSTTAQPKRRTKKPQTDYDYYDEGDFSFIGKPRAKDVKVVLHGNGIIECLDHGNFPHPLSCRKFISCAKFETGGVVGWEYTCPKGTSYDPVGSMCNWAAGLGCKD